MKTQKNSLPSILCIFLSSTLLASCASSPNTTVVESATGTFRIYPDMDRNVVHVGDPVVFEFDPKDKNIYMNAVSINTGEGNIKCGDNKCRVPYKYKKAGCYNVSVQYNGAAIAEKKIVILKHYLTDQELYYETVKKVAEELQKGIKQVAEKKLCRKT